MSLDFLSYSRIQEIDWSHSELLCYPSQLDTELVLRLEAKVEMGRKRQNDSAMLAVCTLPLIPVIFLEGEPIYLSEARSQVRKLLATHYLLDLEKSPVVAPEEVATIDVLAGDLDGEANLDLANLKGVPD